MYPAGPVRVRHEETCEVARRAAERVREWTPRLRVVEPAGIEPATS
jgi:hypothetical protein